MHVIVIGYLFVILMMSITYYPDLQAMLVRLIGLGILPAWLWLKLVGFVRAKPVDPAISDSPSDHTAPDDDKKKNADHL